MLEEIFKYLGGTAIISVALAWTTKSIVSHFLSKDIEGHKQRLEAQNQLAIEQLKADLQKQLLEHEIRFSRLHAKRAEIIAETYSLLHDVYDRLSDYVKIFEPAGGTPRDLRQKAAIAAHEAFQPYYRKRLVFFPKGIAEMLESVDRQLVGAHNEFVLGVEMADGRNTADKWNKVFDTVSVNIKAALRELEDEFRRLLGDESNPLSKKT